MSGNATTAGHPTTANGKPQTTSTGVIMVWVHYHPCDYSPHNNTTYDIVNSSDGGDGTAVTN